MKNIIKKVLKETYEQQQLNDICNQLSTGSNKISEEYMNNLESFINSSDLPPYIKNNTKKVFDAWRKDVYYGVKKDSFGRMTGDSESDESDTYLSQIQTIICGNYMEAMD